MIHERNLVKLRLWRMSMGFYEKSFIKMSCNFHFLLTLKKSSRNSTLRQSERYIKAVEV